MKLPLSRIGPLFKLTHYRGDAISPVSGRSKAEKLQKRVPLAGAGSGRFKLHTRTPNSNGNQVLKDRREAVLFVSRRVATLLGRADEVIE